MKFCALLILFGSLSAHAIQSVNNCDLPVADENVLGSAGTILAVADKISKGVVDSFAKNCPQRPPREPLFHATNITDLKLEIQKKFKDLGLQIKWNRKGVFGRPKRQLGSGSWESFQNNPEDITRLKNLANVSYYSMAQYPPGVFGNMGLTSIYLTKNMNVAGQKRKAMPAPEKDALLLADNDDLVCSVGMEQRVHHEFFHFMEGQVNGNMRFNHPDWKALNPEDFKYGDGGHEVYNCTGGFNNTGHVRTGFVSRYALTALEEDRAETFAWMMTRGYSEQMKMFTIVDPVLKQKRELMLKFLQTRVSTRLTDEFFNNQPQD